jgi:hypothetical protein
VTQLISDNAACNCSTVDDFQLSVSDPPTREEMQSIADALSVLIAALKRPQ